MGGDKGRGKGIVEVGRCDGWAIGIMDGEMGVVVGEANFDEDISIVGCGLNQLVNKGGGGALQNDGIALDEEFGFFFFKPEGNAFFGGARMILADHVAGDLGEIDNFPFLEDEFTVAEEKSIVEVVGDSGDVGLQVFEQGGDLTGR